MLGTGSLQSGDGRCRTKKGITLGDYVWGAVAIPLSLGADCLVEKKERRKDGISLKARETNRYLSISKPEDVTMPS